MNYKKLVLIIALLITTIGFSQNGINYKAMIKDNSGTVIANQSVDLQFSILEGSSQINVYTETHTATTDGSGIVIVNVGEGTPSSGTYANINWDNGEHYLNVQVDTGSGMVDMGTTQFKTVPYALNAANVSGLEQLDEGNGLGWRLKGRDPNNFGNLGLGAIDFSYSSVPSSTLGATGNYSTTFGYDNTASGGASLSSGYSSQATGEYSTAMGYNTEATDFAATALGLGTSAIGYASTSLGHQTTASGDYSTAIGYYSEASADSATAMGNGSHATASGATAMGHYTEATANYATAMGYFTEATASSATATGFYTNATGQNSVAMNYYTTALGENSVAMGESTAANGQNSTAMGYTTIASGFTSMASGHNTLSSGNYATTFGVNIKAESYNDLAIGSFNVGGGSYNSWIGTDPLFEIGNGLSESNRKNALTVLKNGNVGIGKSSGINGRLEVASASGLTSPQLYLHETTTGYTRLNFSNTNRSDFWAIGAYIGTSSSSDKFNIYNSAVGDIMSIQGNGNVLVGGSVVHSSDRRLKKDIADISYGLNEILQLQPKEYNWKNKKQTAKSLGLIAQDVQPIISNIVHQNDDELKTLSVSYTELIPVLIKAIQEQQDIIAKQDLKIKELTAESNQKDTALQSFDQRLKQVEALVGTNP
ncbi:MAG: tail fiber domain-containing protein [Flavobacteriaceae bacterium]|nr:tail fiber domain-containing protein [Mangrovimonas sp.]MCB0431534.1 tail fiber domain-containing protein [Mangrovimonas sp.]MCB0435829.1 tail fiber domain-containing protein [Mangrovimonas sp.]